MDRPAAFAIMAHPDDIEFVAAGTLLLLGEAGYDLHYMTLADGCCGSLTQDAVSTARVRQRESQAAAEILGAHWHGPIGHDLEIMYNLDLLRQLAAIIRKVSPEIILTHYPSDYMEDHTNTCRLVVTAAFARGMPNFVTKPPSQPSDRECTLYHAMPHGLRDPLKRPILADFFIDTSPVHQRKCQALAAHESQAQWLDATQGMCSHVGSMDAMSRQMGQLSGEFEHAEGWTRHLHLGFSQNEIDPLRRVLGGYASVGIRNEL